MTAVNGLGFYPFRGHARFRPLAAVPRFSKITTPLTMKELEAGVVPPPRKQSTYVKARRNLPGELPGSLPGISGKSFAPLPPPMHSRFTESPTAGPPAIPVLDRWGGRAPQVSQKPKAKCQMLASPANCQLPFASLFSC